jgi:hypothetical protein
MIYIALWLWFVGAYMMWEDIRDTTDTRPSPQGYFFDPAAQAFHDSHPELHRLMYVLVQVSMVVGWPIAMTMGIIHQIRIKIRLR